MASAGEAVATATRRQATGGRQQVAGNRWQATGDTTVKIIETRAAPNPRRVRIFLAEKGIAVPFEEVDLMTGALAEPAFVALNPLRRVPMLVLDDGAVIAETVAI